MKLSKIAELINGEITGNADVEITGVAGISDAKEGDITFFSDPKLIKECISSNASCIVVKEVLKEISRPQIKVSNPQYAFARLLEHFYVKPHKPSGINENAFVSGKANIGTDVSIYSNAYISDNASVGKKTIIYPGVFIGENSSIGDDCIIYPNAVIRENVRIGNRVIIHAGSVIGSDGFGYILEKGVHFKIPQTGGVIINDDVEIGANVTIDRATIGNTVIGKGTKIDNLSQIAHNVKIGENTIIVAQVGIAGSANIGNLVILGGQVGVADHSKIEDGAMVAAQAGVVGNLPKGVYSGSPAISHRDYLRAIISLPKLPDLIYKIKELEEKIKTFERREKE
ncbi:MAG: UDP-3-O-(3-hydroxymyristoyl)glucosamine N-acyltransferase [Nitrospiraceae bacterium]|nr:UDP-3-O-(3-hydroxymyristoyl)glucosamine N-acyltransferase [Nitrospiraceae bacterium]